MADLIIRRAHHDDVQALLDIYNYEVVNGVSTLDLTPKSLEERMAWFYAHESDLHPLYVAELEGHVVGYSTLSSYRSKEAYLPTVELSVYVDRDFRGQGVASALMGAIVEHARECPDIHLVVSIITGENEASVRLHEKFGFSWCGVVHEAGFKHGRYLDIITYELIV